MAINMADGAHIQHCTAVTNVIRKKSSSNMHRPCAGATTGGQTITATDDVVCETRMWLAKFALTTAVACMQKNEATILLQQTVYNSQTIFSMTDKMLCQWRNTVTIFSRLQQCIHHTFWNYYKLLFSLIYSLKTDLGLFKLVIYPVLPWYM